MRQAPLSRSLLTLLSLALAAAAARAADPELRVLPEAPLAPPAQLQAVLKAQVHAAMDRREAAYEQLKTPEQLIAYQERVRAFFREQLGPFPDRTPLNARVVGRLQRDGYQVQKVIYESRPGFHVTALLYLPETPPPYPGVLLPCGHSENGKAAEAYQRASILLAKNGLAVLCFDPVGQGERKQLLDPAGQGRFRATAEHALEAAGANLLGGNLATQMVWDGMRSLDYLLSRPDIDPKRIGCTGNSGGGTQTAYLMALDPRITCAAPSCYLTTFRRLIDTIGPQDPEQNLFGQLAFGMDHADYVLLRAPKPTLMCAATRDFFDIRGTWDTFRQAKRFYTRMGFPERVEIAETDAAHGFSPQLRVAATRWMRRWLLGKDDAITEPEFPVLTDEQAQCTPQGQVLLLPGARSIWDLYREQEGVLAVRRRAAPQAPAALRQAVRRLAGIRELGELAAVVPESRGTVTRQGYRIERLALPGARPGGTRAKPGVVLPALAFVPPNPGPEAVLYLHERGKEAEAAPGGAIEAFLRRGQAVLAVDLRGLGELQARTGGEPAGTSGRDVALAYLLGRSFVGLRAEDTLRAARLLAEGGVPGLAGRRRVHLVAVGEAGPPALHAAALEPELFASVLLQRSLVSYGAIARAALTRDERVHTVHGALREYDLPDLQALLGGRIRVEEPQAPESAR